MSARENKQWSKPQLIVPGTRKPEENVLGGYAITAPKKQWSKPQLIVLGRVKSAEVSNVLPACINPAAYPISRS